LGGLEPNTIMLAYPKQWENDELKAKRFVSIIRNAHIFWSFNYCLETLENV